MNVRIPLLIAAGVLLASSAGAQVASSAAITVDDLTSVLMPGVNATANTPSYLRFSNADSVAATATVQLRDPATGNVLAIWTTPSLPPGGTLETPISEILAISTFPGIAAAQGGLLAEIQGHFIGHVQHVVLSPATGTLLNASNCGMVLMADPLSLSYVSGPGRSGVGGQIRITNASATVASVTLTFKDNAGRTWNWTSPQVAAFGAVTRNTGEIFTAAGVAADVRSLSVVSSPAPAGLTLSYTEGLIGVPVQADFSAACMLTSPATPGTATAGAGGGAMPGMTPIPTPQPATTPSPAVDPNAMCNMMGMGMMMGMDDMGCGMTMSARVPTAP
ncbi:MAG: hypothetical protein ACXWN9_13640 [Candidatus Binataceae bacterium]